MPGVQNKDDASKQAKDAVIHLANAEKGVQPVQLSMMELEQLGKRAVGVVRETVEAAGKEGRPLALSELLVEPSWQEVLGGEFSKPYMTTLQTFLNSEWSKNKVYPPKELIFRWSLRRLREGWVGSTDAGSSGWHV